MNHLLSELRTLTPHLRLDFGKFGIFVNSRYCYQALFPVRGYQSRAGVYGHKHEETVEFSLPEDVIKRRAAECNVFRFISAYREFGHLKADINPLQPNKRVVPELDPHLYGLRSDEIYNLKGLIAGCDKTCTLEQLQDILQQKYCGHIGAEFVYLPTLEEREWFAATLETAQEKVLTTEERIKLAEDMLRSQVFDNFLAIKFQSVKRYGGEGAESMVGFFTEAFKRIAQGCLPSLGDCRSGNLH